MLKNIAENMINFMFSTHILENIIRFLISILVNRNDCIINKDINKLLFDKED